MNERNRVYLDGMWEFALPGGAFEKRKVPGSYPCVGDSVYRRTIELQKPHNKRMRICFEGIAYEGKVFFNGIELGKMLPYSFYAFEVTSLIKDGTNEVYVELADLTAGFGPAEGWKSYSGIVRSVYMEEVGDCFVEDFFFKYSFEDGYRAANCVLDYSIDGNADGVQIRAVLTKQQQIASCQICDTADGTISLMVQNPELWSPNNPFLYELSLQLIKDDEILDSINTRVGFKDFRIEGSKFTLNGETIFLIGVCRHDLWTDKHGFTQTDAMIEQDLRMIKDLGVNYVRLVHYPHDRRVVEMADRIGLLVSEEPGLWWSDLHNKTITDSALQVLENVIRRDRNHVSVAFWLSFNECMYTDEFLWDAAAVTRRMDPTRYISGANCLDPTETKRIFDDNGFDFYTMHPYGTHPTHAGRSSIDEICTILSGKPLLFTEWGGYYVQGNPNLFEEFCRKMFELSHQEAPQPTLAGMCFWEWQDVYEAQRGEPACQDGLLTEGLVTIDRKPKDLYYTYRKMITQYFCPPLPRESEVELSGAGSSSCVYVPLSIQDRAGDELWKAAIEASIPMHGFTNKPRRRISLGPIIPEQISRLGALLVDIPKGRPVIVGPGAEKCSVQVGQAASAVWFIGQCTMDKGYPIRGALGEPIGQYIITFTDGSTMEVPIRNGMETHTVFSLISPTEFDPRAVNASRAFTVYHDRNWEIYKASLLRVQLPNGREIDKIEIHVDNKEYYLLVYGITLEK